MTEVNFFFFAMSKAKKKKKTHWRDGKCKKEEIYFVQVIYFTYDNIYISMLFSQICCLTYRVIVTIFLNSIYMC